MAPRLWLTLIRPQDIIWLLLFSALAAVSPARHSMEIFLLSCLAALQVLEPKIPYLLTSQGNVVSVLMKLGLGYMLIGYTGGVTSSYYLILLLPVVSAATTMGLLGTTAFTLLACASYLSFLLFVDWVRFTIEPDDFRELGLRLLFLAVVGYLTNRLAEANRVEARKYQTAAEQLAEANRSLQAAEAAVRRSERLAALGQLSAGLSHELRNPLGTIRASAEMLKKNVAGGDAIAAEIAGFIVTEADRTNSLVTRFLDFARPLELRREQADLSDIIDRAVSQLKRRPDGARISVYKNYSPDIPPLSVDAELMERVIYNLLANAAEATPHEGAITVKTRPMDGAVEISVIDRGTGIDPKHRENIFNPFFTTKPHGVGLGLPIVSKIVDEHGGTMSVESGVGEGSVFRVYLPAGGQDRPSATR